MPLRLLDIAIDYVRETPAWPVLRPAAALLSLYVTALILAYQFVEWQYRLSTPLALFLRSYLVKQVTVVCVAVAVAGFLLLRLMRPVAPVAAGAPGRRWNWPGRRPVATLVALALVAAGAAGLFTWLAPRAGQRPCPVPGPAADRSLCPGLHLV